MALLEHVNTIASNDTVHQVSAGTAVSSVTLITQTDINTIKAVILSAVLSGLIQLLIKLFKTLTRKLNGTNTQNSVQTDTQDKNP